MAGTCMEWLLAKAMSNPHDSFSTTTKKMVCLMLAFVVAPFAFGGALLTVRYFINGGPVLAAPVVHIIVPVIWMLVFLTNYVVLRRSKGILREYQVDVALWTLALGWIVFCISVPNCEPRLALCIMLCVAALSHIRTFWSLFILMNVVQVLSITIDLLWGYHEDYEFARNGAEYLTVPGSSKFTPFTFAISSLFIQGFQTALVLTVKAQTAVHDTHLAANQQINAMATEVVEHLGAYDTERSRATIEEYAQSFGFAFNNTAAVASDPDVTRDDEEEAEDTDSSGPRQGGAAGRLIKAFHRMNENLDRYKPFLPNYLFLQDEEREKGAAEDEDEGEIGIAVDDASAVSSKHATSTRTSEQGSRLHAPDRAGRRRSYASSAGRSSRASSRAKDDGAIVRVGAMMSPTDTSFRGKVSQVLMDISHSTVFATQQRAGHHRRGGPGGVGSAAPVALPELVDLIFLTAKSTKGSVHSMLGDRAHLTWNATHRVPMPETKACQFLLKLRGSVLTTSGAHRATPRATPPPQGGAALGSARPSPFSACVFSGAATTHSITAQKSRQQAIILDAEWLPALESTFQFACRFGTLIIDELTQRIATYHIVARPVDRISFSPRSVELEASEAGQVASWMTAAGRGDVHGPPKLECDGQASGFFLNGADGPLDLVKPTAVGDSSHSPLAPPTSVSHAAMTTTTVRTLFELLQEANAAEDEWMYQLEEKEQATSAFESAFTAAFELLTAPPAPAATIIVVDGKEIPSSAGPSSNKFQEVKGKLCTHIQDLNGGALREAQKPFFGSARLIQRWYRWVEECAETQQTVKL